MKWKVIRVQNTEDQALIELEKFFKAQLENHTNDGGGIRFGTFNIFWKEGICKLSENSGCLLSISIKDNLSKIERKKNHIYHDFAKFLSEKIKGIDTSENNLRMLVFAFDGLVNEGCEYVKLGTKMRQFVLENYKEDKQKHYTRYIKKN